MGHLLGDHRVALASVSALSLATGIPLTVHMLWHLQVWWSNNTVFSVVMTQMLHVDLSCGNGNDCD